MHDVPTSTALLQLADLGRDPDPPRWHWGIARVEAIGRLVLPAEARTALATGQPSAVHGGCNRVALVLRTDGAGVVIAVDRRGRLRLPVWLRRAAAGSGSLLHTRLTRGRGPGPFESAAQPLLTIARKSF